MKAHIITVDGSDNPSLLGSRLTELANKWIEDNSDNILSISSINTHLNRGVGMVTIVYRQRYECVCVT